jgi:MFS family permease
MITLMFMSANIGGGMISVLMPVYAREFLNGDAQTYGLLVSAGAIGGFAGSLAVGAIAWPWTLGRSIAVAQLLSGLAFAGLLAAPGIGPAIALFMLSDLLSAPLTIWAQTVRMRLIPPHLRGRVFSLLRTLMQATPPLGGVVAGALLAQPGQGIEPTILAIVVTIGAPALVGLVHPALAHQQTVAPEEA